MLKAFTRSSFGDTAVTMLHPNEMISQEDPTGFTMKTSIIKTSLGVLRRHTSKGEIKGKTLIGLSGNSSRIGAWSRLGLLSNNTSGTRRENIRFMGEFEKAINKLVGIIEIPITGMAKTLVPQELLSFSLDSMNRNRLVNKSMESNSILQTLGNTGQARLKILMNLKQIQIKSRNNRGSIV